MLRFPGAAYREVAGWPAPGDHREPGELARLAIEWIATNQEFIRAQLPAESGFDHRDVISLMMFRAYKGGGLAHPLRGHVNGTAPISNSRAVLLRHASWAAGECRDIASVRYEAATDWSDPTAPTAPPTWDSHGNADGYLRLIGILSEECHDALTGRQEGDTRSDLEHAALYVTSRLPALWAIFRKYAPASVNAIVAAWDDDSRACVLLAVFPAQLPHRAVTAYRQVTAGAEQDGITVEATQRKISRLRDRLRAAWPPELVPPGIKAAGSAMRGDDSTQEVP